MTERAVRREICGIGRRMYARGLVASFDGNVSVRLPGGRIVATPTGMCKGFLSPRDLVVVDLEGRVLKGRRAPSSELRMHLRVYFENPAVQAVVHAHPPVATSYAIAGYRLDRAILAESVVNLGVVPVAPYATPGTEDVPDSIAPFCRTHNAVLLANHGALTWGPSLQEAYGRMESLESYATLLMNTLGLIGRANELSTAQIEELLETRRRLGIESGGVPPSVAAETNRSEFPGVPAPERHEPL